MTEKSEHPGPLAGIRVLELGQLIAGPFTGCLLGYYGAEVIKVERPGEGDPLRTWRLLDEGTSLWWRSVARNKKCVTVNLRSEEGRGIVRQLASESDVLIENFRPGSMERWGLGPDELMADNPGLIYARISGYGQTGPYASRPGFASVCEGVGGFRYINGFPDRPPVRPNLSMGDTLAAMHAALGILMACISKLQDPEHRGQVIDVAIYEAVFNMLESVVPEYDRLGEIRQPSGSTLTGIVPTNTYLCGD
ncbi:MAG: CaiB/BaiF CoA-transferase family protein, partial [Gammaproteobacteria bacterium]